MSINKIETTLKESLAKAVISGNLKSEIDATKIVIEIPKDKKNGDYSSNIAMKLTRELRQNPRMIATAIIDNLDKEAAGIDRVEIAGPGFINFFMKGDTLNAVIGEVLKEGDTYGNSNYGKGEKFNVEFVSANPTGDLHLGHARGASLGDSICRIMSAAGYDVTREYYINDAGNQINNLAYSLMARYNQAFGMEVEMPEDGYHGKDVIKIAEDIKAEIGDKYLNDNSEEAYKYFRKVGVEKELAKLKGVLEDFRVHFDVWFSETSLYEENRIVPTLEKLKEGGYTYEQDGALWLRTTDFGDDKDRVLIKTKINGLYINAVIKLSLNIFITHLVAPQLGQSILKFLYMKQLGTNFNKLDSDI